MTVELIIIAVLGTVWKSHSKRLEELEIVDYEDNCCTHHYCSAEKSHSKRLKELEIVDHEDNCCTHHYCSAENCLEEPWKETERSSNCGS